MPAMKMAQEMVKVWRRPNMSQINPAFKAPAIEKKFMEPVCLRTGQEGQGVTKGRMNSKKGKDLRHQIPPGTHSSIS